MIVLTIYKHVGRQVDQIAEALRDTGKHRPREFSAGRDRLAGKHHMDKPQALWLTGRGGSISVSVVVPNSLRGGPSPVSVRRPNQRRSLSRSATRALDVLEFFGQARRPLRAIEISRMLGMRPSTTDQLLKTMVDSSHLVFDAQTKCYLPSPRLVGFGSWIVDMFGADQRLRGLVRDVQSRTDATVTITTPNDLFMQVLDLAVPPDQQAERGMRISVFGSSVGSAYLATLGDNAVRRLAERARIAGTEMPRILHDVAQIRSEGFADGPTGDGEIWSIARPLPIEGLALPMVLGLAGPTERVKRDRDALQRVMAEAIERWISHRPIPSSAAPE